MTKIVILTEGDAAKQEHVEDNGMEAYVKAHGKHFTQKLLNYATSLMRKKDAATGKERQIIPYSQLEVDDLLERNGVTLSSKQELDYVYVANMAKADYWKSSIEDEKHLALFIKDTVDDIDAPECAVFCRWAATACKENDIPWDELI